jgi:putative ABC transport system substrate-binding protein
MRRRNFIALLGGAAAWPVAARAQQAAMPVVGILGAPSAASYTRHVAAIHQGLKEAGYIEGQNVRLEYRWAEGRYDSLPALAAELVSQHVAIIVAIGGAPPTVAAKAATSTIPIVTNIGADPVQLGLVASLNRPGGNVTGVSMLATILEAKRLELLHELVPTATLIAMLVNPNNPQSETQVRDVQEAARALGQRISVLHASTERGLETVLAAPVQERGDALLVGADVFFASQPIMFVLLTARHAIPAIYPWRSHVDAGGLMSYGASVLDSYRQTGVYTGREREGNRSCDSGDSARPRRRSDRVATQFAASAHSRFWH